MNLFLGVNILLGLCIGSFLNVVIYRLPIILKRYWRISCQAYLTNHELPKLSYKYLAWPRSRCMHCDQPIRLRHNIPVLGYIWLRGRCYDCNRSISCQYLCIEILTAFLFALIAWHFGLSWHWFWALWLTSMLIILTGIDIQHQLLPDEITLLLVWLGLILSLWGLFAQSHEAIIGAIAGYLILWTFAHLYQIITGKLAMGHGDFKLLAAVGAWLGWQSLPMIVLISSLAGSLIGLGLLTFKKQSLQTYIPFGPYIAFASWIILIWGKPIMATYYHMMGLSCCMLG